MFAAGIALGFRWTATKMQSSPVPIVTAWLARCARLESRLNTPSCRKVKPTAQSIMPNKEKRAQRRDQQAREIEASQEQLRDSIAETDRLVVIEIRCSDGIAGSARKMTPRNNGPTTATGRKQTLA